MSVSPIDFHEEVVKVIKKVRKDRRPIILEQCGENRGVLVQIKSIWVLEKLTGRKATWIDASDTKHDFDKAWFRLEEEGFIFIATFNEDGTDWNRVCGWVTLEFLADLLNADEDLAQRWDWNNEEHHHYYGP